MSGCLRPDEVIDAVDGVLSAPRLTHLDSCTTCRGLVDETRAALDAARAAGVPEPSPFFWTTVNARVREAIREAPASATPLLGPGWAAWLRWHHLVPLTGVAALVLALFSAVGRSVVDSHVEEPGAVAAERSSDTRVVLSDVREVPSDDALEFMGRLAGLLPESDDTPLEIRPLQDLGDVAAATLSLDEQDALKVLLRAALDRPKS